MRRGNVLKVIDRRLKITLDPLTSSECDVFIYSFIYSFRELRPDRCKEDMARSCCTLSRIKLIPCNNIRTIGSQCPPQAAERQVCFHNKGRGDREFGNSNILRKESFPRSKWEYGNWERIVL